MNALQKIHYSDFIILLLSVIVFVYVYLKWKFQYWKKIAVPNLHPIVPFGDTKKLILGQISFGEQFQQFYNIFKTKGFKHGGVFLGPKPFYIPIDLEIIKSIMQKDFQHFINHGFFIDEKNDPLSAHLFKLENQKWKNMRVKLTPTFTSGKMKMMFQTFADCTIGLKNIMDQAAHDHTPVEIKDILSRFTTDIIGSVAFGIDCNSLADPNVAFRKYGRKVFEFDTWDRLKFTMQFAFPRSLLKFLRFRINRWDVENFFMDVIHKTVAFREENGIARKDFMHLLLQLKNRGKVSDDDRIYDGKKSQAALTMNEVAAQAFVFFGAGFETSSTTMTFALFELAQNPEMQQRLREEIKTVLKKHNGFSYDAIMEMAYMDAVVHETLRKYPPVPMLMRKCNLEYKIPDTLLTIPKDMDVGISVSGIHMDPEYYPNPTVFDPERFSKEGKKTRPPFTWLPFGEGPRLCIGEPKNEVPKFSYILGLRFGLLQSKVGLATLLEKYQVKLNAKTKIPVVMDPNSFVQRAVGGIWLDVESLNGGE